MSKRQWRSGRRSAPLSTKSRATIMIAEGINITSSMLVSLITTLGLAIVFLFKQVISAKDKQIEELQKIKISYQDIASEAIKSAKETADFYRGKYENKAPIVLAAPVISESHSPSTSAQRDASDVATKRASLAAIKLCMGQAPRVEPEHKKE